MNKSNFEYIGSRGSTLKNIFVRFGAQFVVIFINVFMTPYLVKKMGVESFGIVMLVNSVTAFMAILTTAITSSVGRQLTFAVEKDNEELASREISSAFFGLVDIFIKFSLPIALLVFFLGYFLTFPENQATDAKVLLSLSVLSFFALALSGIVGSSMFARNRLELLSLASLVKSLIFVICVVVLFKFFDSSMAMYGTALLFSSLILVFLHYRIHRFLLPTVQFSRKFFSNDVLKRIMSIGGWMTIAQIGGLLFLQTDLVVANKVLGAKLAGEFAIIAVVALQLRALGTLMSSVFAPNQVAIAAADDSNEFSSYLLKSVRITAMFMALLVGLFCGSAQEVLTLWLGADYVHLAPVAVVATSYLVIAMAITPFWNALLAINRVKIPAIVTVVMGVLNVLIAIMLSLKFDLIGLAIAGMLMLTLRNVIFAPWYVARVCRMNLSPLLFELLLGMLVFLAIYYVSLSFNNYLSPNSLLTVIFSLALSTCIGGAIISIVCMDDIRSYWASRLNRKLV